MCISAPKRSLHLEIQRLTRKLFSPEKQRGSKNYFYTQSHMKKASILFLGLVLSVLTSASGDNRFNEVFGPLFHPAHNVPPPVGPRRGLDLLHRWM